VIIVSYNPPDAEPQEWQLEEDSWTVGEIKLIEKHFGGTRQQFFVAVDKGFMTARALLLWVLRSRTEPDLALGDLDDLKDAYLTFHQTFADDEAPDGATDPKDTPSESESSPDASTPE